GGLRQYLDRLADAADLKNDVDAGLLPGLENDALADLFLESRNLNLEEVFARKDLWDHVAPRQVRLGSSGLGSSDIQDRNLSPGNCGARRIGHLADQSGPHALGMK